MCVCAGVLIGYWPLQIFLERWNKCSRLSFTCPRLTSIISLEDDHYLQWVLRIYSPLQVHITFLENLQSVHRQGSEAFNAAFWVINHFPPCNPSSHSRKIAMLYSVTNFMFTSRLTIFINSAISDLHNLGPSCCVHRVDSSRFLSYSISKEEVPLGQLLHQTAETMLPRLLESSFLLF